MPLLLIADPSREEVSKYIDSGVMFVGRDVPQAVAVAIVVPLDESSLEIKNLAVLPEFRGQGAGKQMVRKVVEWSRGQGYARLVVGTGNSSIGNLAFYQKCGFRFLRIERDFFSKRDDSPIYEEGILCRDLLLFEMDLTRQ